MKNTFPFALISGVLLSSCVAGGGLGLGGAGAGASGTSTPTGPNGTGGYVAAGGNSPAAVAPPTKFSDIAWRVKEHSGYYTNAWIIEKYLTLNMPATCLDAIAKTESAYGALSGFAYDIASFGKIATGEDWSTIETSNNNDREKNKLLLEPIMDAFKPSFHITLNYEGDTCETHADANWLRALRTVAGALEDYPPATRKAFITINVSPKFRDTTSKVAQDGSTFEVEFARDLPKGDWSGPITDSFKRVSAK